MLQNYLGGEKGIQINAFMAAMVWDLKKLMKNLREDFLHFIFQLFFPQNFYNYAA
nr:hypothetical protein [Paludibacter sp.]